MTEEARDIRENVYFNELEFTAFKACCDEIGVARSIVLRQLALNWVKRQHQEKMMRENGLSDRRSVNPL